MNYANVFVMKCTIYTKYALLINNQKPHKIRASNYPRKNKLTPTTEITAPMTAFHVMG